MEKEVGRKEEAKGPEPVEGGEGVGLPNYGFLNPKPEDQNPKTKAQKPKPKKRAALNFKR
mgnify:CR=1 FL=1